MEILYHNLYGIYETQMTGIEYATRSKLYVTYYNICHI